MPLNAVLIHLWNFLCDSFKLPSYLARGFSTTLPYISMRGVQNNLFTLLWGGFQNFPCMWLWGGGLRPPLYIAMRVFRTTPIRVYEGFSNFLHIFLWGGVKPPSYITKKLVSTHLHISLWVVFQTTTINCYKEGSKLPPKLNSSWPFVARFGPQIRGVKNGLYILLWGGY